MSSAYILGITLMKEQSSQVTETKSSYQPWNKGLLKPYQGALKVFLLPNLYQRNQGRSQPTDLKAQAYKCLV